MSNRPKLSLHEPAIPVTRGSLMEFADDPIACMRRLHRDHGDLEDRRKLVLGIDARVSAGLPVVEG